MIQVKVLKLAGETGLRQPGSTYFEYEARAAKLCAGGFVSILSETAADIGQVKEEKTVIETKEEKFKPKTKDKPKGRPKRK